MTSYNLRAADLPFRLKFLVIYGRDQLLSTQSKDVEKVSHFLGWFALVDLLGPLCLADHHLLS